MSSNNEKIKIIFLGTPDFASYCLKSLIDEDDIEVLFSVTKPDIKKNRGMKIEEPEVKIVSKEYNIKCYQTNKIKEDKELIEMMKSSKPDFLVVVSFGEILSKEILDIPLKASINGHASLLPKYRGASPIQTAILNGDKTTGVTTMLMSIGLDEGDILEQEKIDIEDKETQISLFEKLKKINAELMIRTLKNFDNITPIKQDEQNMTKSKIIKKEDGLLDLENENAKEIYQKVYAYNPWPSAYLKNINGILKIWDVDYVDDNIKNQLDYYIQNEMDDIWQLRDNVIVYNKNLYIKTKDSFLKVNELQPQSKKRMSYKDYINGLK